MLFFWKFYQSKKPEKMYQFLQKKCQDWFFFYIDNIW